MAECELLSICGFFKKYSESRNLVCRSFIRAYCRGKNMDKCHRKKYREEHGKPPPDEMLPSGAC
jgi:hypothetical protein